MIMRSLRALATDPAGVVRAVPRELQQVLQWRQADDSRLRSQVDEAWNERLHHLLGAPWPCPEAGQLDPVMADIGAQLAAHGLKAGRSTYGWYSDADSSLCRALWCTALHTKPEVIIETGVARGVTSRVVLEALNRNGSGHLWSIDLPFPFDHELRGQTGVAVPDTCRGRWSYLEGTSRQRLPALAAEVGHAEMFIHDSLHTAKNVAFEMEQAGALMAQGGVMLVDDIGSHDSFTSFARRHPRYQTIICPSEDRGGIFGIAAAAAGSSAAASLPGRGV